MDIIQSFYYSSNKDRQQELELCLKKNLFSEFINNIHIFITQKDYNTFLQSNFITNKNYKKLFFIIHDNQPSYSELFTYSSKLDNKICCICNSDIEITIQNNNILLLDMLRNTKKIFFITRYESNGSSYLIDNFGGSHDAFIFHSNTLFKNLVNMSLNFIDYIQNTSGIEAILTIFFIEKLNYIVENPCFQIKIIHHHESNIRQWQQINGNKIVGYTSPTPNNNNWGIHNKHMIYPKEY